MNLVFIDLGFTNDEKSISNNKLCYREITKFNAVMLDEKYRLKNVFSSQVKPEYTPVALENAPSLEGVLSYFYNWLGEEEYKPYFLCPEDKIQICQECTTKGIYNKIEDLIARLP